MKHLEQEVQWIGGVIIGGPDETGAVKVHKYVLGSMLVMHSNMDLLASHTVSTPRAGTFSKLLRMRSIGTATFFSPGV